MWLHCTSGLRNSNGVPPHLLSDLVKKRTVHATRAQPCFDGLRGRGRDVDAALGRQLHVRVEDEQALRQQVGRVEQQLVVSGLQPEQDLLLAVVGLAVLREEHDPLLVRQHVPEAAIRRQLDGIARGSWRVLAFDGVPKAREQLQRQHPVRAFLRVREQVLYEQAQAR